MWLSWAILCLYYSEAKYEDAAAWCMLLLVCFVDAVIYQDVSSPVKSYSFPICCSREATLLH
jgi:hypothetical protein